MVSLYVQGSLTYTVKMVATKKGKIVSPDGKVAAYFDDFYTETVRTTD